MGWRKKGSSRVLPWVEIPRQDRPSLPPLKYLENTPLAHQIKSPPVPLPLTSLRLVILRPSFWWTLKGAETGQDDESQGKKKDLGGSKKTLGLWGQ